MLEVETHQRILIDPTCADSPKRIFVRELLRELFPFLNEIERREHAKLNNQKKHHNPKAAGLVGRSMNTPLSPIVK